MKGEGIALLLEIYRQSLSTPRAGLADPSSSKRNTTRKETLSETTTFPHTDDVSSPRSYNPYTQQEWESRVRDFEKSLQPLETAAANSFRR